MQKQNSQLKTELKRRAYQYSIRMIQFLDSLPKDSSTSVITKQLLRSATSIGANIAEGAGRKTNKDFARALYFSFGSIKELEHFLLLAKDLNYIDICNFNAFNQQLEIIGKMLNKFIQCLDK